MRNAHGSNQPPPPPPPPPPPDFINSPDKNMVLEGMMDDKFQFVHPFTMIVAGPTMSGKSTFIKYLLLLHEHLFHPAPERVLWIYKRWQPLYDELKNWISGIIFIQGITEDIKSDTFMNARERTLLIIDMS